MPCVPAKADVWSLGILLHVLLTGLIPLRPEDSPLECELSKEKLPDDEQLLDLFNVMLRVQPKERAGISDILSHPWLECTEDGEHSKLIRCAVDFDVFLVFSIEIYMEEHDNGFFSVDSDLYEAEFVVKVSLFVYNKFVVDLMKFFESSENLLKPKDPRRFIVVGDSHEIPADLVVRYC